MLKKILRKLAERNGFTSVLWNLPRLAKGYQPIFLDYPVVSIPRYGYGKPGHPELTAILASGDDRYRQILSGFLGFTPELLKIPVRANSLIDLSWTNKWFSGLDMFALYGFIADRKPSLYVEVGSGVSTQIVRRAVRDHKLATKIHSIDPHPRADIDAMCDKIIREPLETSDLSFVAHLHAGDILFIDGSHRVFMNSDVTVLFLEILPRLRSGVIVHIHDIYLPIDYPPDRAHWFYSEQYLLAAALLGGHKNFEVLLPNHYISFADGLSEIMSAFWSRPELSEALTSGVSFWLEIV